MFFKLLPEVYLIFGKRKSLLQNISTKKALWINNDIAKHIKSCENNNPITDEFLKYAKELSDNEWGKITELPIFSEKLRLTNVSDKRQIHQKAPIIDHATLKLTDECNLTCSKCGKFFCPSCIKEGVGKSISLEMIKSIIKKLKLYRCKTVLLTGGEIALIKDLKSIYEVIRENNFNIMLNTNGVKKLDNFFKNANIFISVFLKDDLIKVINNYIDFNNITIVKFFDDEYKIDLPNNWKYIDRSSNVHKITKNSLMNMSMERFHLRQNNDTCLNGKIVINSKGDVYPCLESIKFSKKVGNINADKWEHIIQRLSNNFWKRKIDEHRICKKCEFRYACNSCIFDDVEKNCCYDMELGIWK